MNQQEIFDAWKSQQSRQDAGGEFADRVMTRIRRRETTPSAGRLTALLGYIVRRPWAKAAVIIIGAILGIARIVATAHLVLFAS